MMHNPPVKTLTPGTPDQRYYIVKFISNLNTDGINHYYIVKFISKLNIDEHETILMNIIQMLSSLTYIPSLKWLDMPLPLHQPQ